MIIRWFPESEMAIFLESEQYVIFPGNLNTLGGIRSRERGSSWFESLFEKYFKVELINELSVFLWPSPIRRRMASESGPKNKQNFLITIW